MKYFQYLRKIENYIDTTKLWSGRNFAFLFFLIYFGLTLYITFTYNFASVADWYAIIACYLSTFGFAFPPTQEYFKDNPEVNKKLNVFFLVNIITFIIVVLVENCCF